MFPLLQNRFTSLAFIVPAYLIFNIFFVFKLNAIPNNDPVQVPAYVTLTRADTFIDPLSYRFKADFLSRRETKDFYFDSGSKVHVPFSHMYFSGQHGMYHNYHFVTLWLTKKEGGDPESELRAYFAIPLFRSPEKMEPLTLNTMDLAFNQLNKRVPVDLSLFLPSFFILKEEKHHASLSMCFNETLTDYADAQHQDTYVITADSSFQYFIVDVTKGKVVYENIVNNVLPQNGSCDSLSTTIGFYNGIASQTTLPPSTIPTMYSMFDNTKAVSPLGLMTAVYIFPMLPHHHFPSKTIADLNHMHRHFQLQASDHLRHLHQYLKDRGILVNNGLLLTTKLNNSASLKLLLKSFSFNLFENNAAIHESTELKSFFEKSLYTLSENDELQNLKRKGCAIPEQLLKHQVPELKVTIINNITLEFEWKNKFALISRYETFFGVTDKALRFFSYIGASLKYLDEPSYFAAALPLMPSTLRSGSENAMVILIHEKKGHRVPYSFGFIQQVHQQLQLKSDMLISLALPSFQIQQHNYWNRSEFPHFSTTDSELSLYISTKELLDLQIHQMVKVCIHKNGAGKDRAPRTREFAARHQKFHSFNTPFYFAMVDEKTGVPLFSYKVEDVPNDSEICKDF